MLTEDYDDDDAALAYSSSEDDDSDRFSLTGPLSQDAAGNQEAVDGIGWASQQDDEDQDIHSLSHWGPSKSVYYDNDKRETEHDAEEDEAEARRIQQKRLKALSEADFGFDEHAWANTGREDGKGDADAGVNDEDGDVVIRIAPEPQFFPGMDNAEKSTLLRKLYPDIEPLSQEFEELYPVWERLTTAHHRQERTNGVKKSSSTALVNQWRALSGYLSSISMYFAILTSPARDSDGKEVEEAAPLAPEAIRSHEIMVHIAEARESWNAAREVEDGPDGSDILGDETGSAPANVQGADGSSQNESASFECPQNGHPGSMISLNSSSTIPKQTGIGACASSTPESRRAKRLQRTEDSLAELRNDIRDARRKGAVQRHQAIHSSARGEPPELGDARLTAQGLATKSRQKRSLRFYTSQIAQKDAKQANVRNRHNAQGDDDIPHRERQRDRGERLNRAAEKREMKSREDREASEQGMTVGSDEEEPRNKLAADLIPDGDDQYLAQLEQQVHLKTEAKRAREAAYAIARDSGERVVQRSMPGESAGIGGRRDIGYTIEKNKGLTPARKKEVKNPRVKKRKRFEDKTKKLKHMKPTYKGGEGRGGYRGELTGIKKSLVRSVKL